jgi:hypothetical protein
MRNRAGEQTSCGVICKTHGQGDQYVSLAGHVKGKEMPRDVSFFQAGFLLLLLKINRGRTTYIKS